MKKLITYLLLFFTVVGYSQSIGSYLSNLYKYNKESKFKEIKEEIIYYNKDGIKKEIEYKSFNEYMNLRSLKRFDDKKKLVWLNIYKYDSLQRRTKLENKYWVNIVGYQKKYREYEYDSIGNFLEIQFNSNKQVTYITKYFFDKENNLIQLANYNGGGNLIGYEKATYFTEKNRVKISQFNNQGKLITTNSHSIDHSKDSKHKHKPHYKYNEHGDLIFWERNLNQNDKVCYTMEYKYDEKGNWISKKRYSHIKTDSGKLKKKKIKVSQTRKIKYQE